MYRIQVSENTQVEFVEVEWKRVADTGNPRDNNAVYEFVQKPVVLKDSTRQIYEQTVEKLDLPAVIGAVNGLDMPLR